MRFFHFLLIINFVFVIGCSSKSELTPNGRFYGIHPSSSGANETNLVMIHGMCNRGQEWVIKMQKILAEHYGMEAERELKLIPLKHEVQLWKTGIFDENSRINIYGILYSHLTKKEKEALCYDVSPPAGEICDSPGYTGNRAKLNALGKNFINDCLADVFIYAGKTGAKIREGVKLALAAINRDVLEANHSTFLWSSSMGSIVLRDILYCDEGQEQAFNQSIELVKNIKTFFLIANPIPIFNLAKTCQNKNPSLSPDASLFEVISSIKQASGQSPKRSNNSQRENINSIVSFTDKNDLLSYEVRPEDFNRGILIKGSVSNGPIWFRLFQNPITAHTNYIENTELMNWVKCGNQVADTDKCLVISED